MNFRRVILQPFQMLDSVPLYVLKRAIFDRAEKKADQATWIGRNQGIVITQFWKYILGKREDPLYNVLVEIE